MFLSVSERVKIVFVSLNVIVLKSSETLRCDHETLRNGQKSPGNVHENSHANGQERRTLENVHDFMKLYYQCYELLLQLLHERARIDNRRNCSYA